MGPHPARTLALWEGSTGDGGDRSISTTSGQRSESDIYLRLDLAKSEDSWRVDGVTNLRFALAPTSDTHPGG